MLKYDGVDPQGGAQYSRYERSRVEAVFKETLKKEKDLTDRYPKVTSFQMNLANGNTRGFLVNLKHSHNPNMIITEKVEKKTPLERNTTPPQRSEADLYGDRMIRHSELTPWQKVDLPQSRAQEIGWLVAASMQSDTLNRIRAHSRRENPVGAARTEAYRTASLADMSNGRLGPGGLETNPASLTGTKYDPLCQSAPMLPRLMPHLPDDGQREECQMLNRNKRKGKKTCPETVYADAYYAQMRCSPFNQAAARG